ncbi:LysM peptidoglycan-binding domain-containing protein [Vibrio europaeus]|uniref:LysM peptidoglycan-binding domain-containing protein n=1 Tax=Vibrio europaeus TaxID=300876 RepID=A0AAE7AVS4_9VIBR|nr:LysM domain-containing protein [Vibrio europaeus]MDC5803303.1 LysM peptidoglycan-binding domain-containing protein [Vibrio europaeus]MDC5823177.1 LysM peptidoglycan-binding domain-containing protein [Vibrio europaeus]MDC5828029.1 LysM peptidoglycan-binding domain-containing protein [Vibrio europaeus]MDC5832909.1 LysM peptidoglycan-binding domain-containing protein [Vibrio europaeus]QJY37667.1 LysM peptidoglycan-binding domain-containing protein [Vibrio europaeus]
MLRIWRGLFVVVLVIIVNGVSAQEGALLINKQAPKTYTVVKGDTLWDISALYLESPWQWPRLWQLNSNIVSPHLIFPGDKLTLVWREGQPKLILKPVVSLTPAIHQRAKQPISVIKPQHILPFIEHDLLLEGEAINEMSRVIGNSTGNQLMDSQNAIYISAHQVAQEWGIYRLMNEFKRADKTAKVVRKIAHGQLVASDERYSSLRLTKQSHEVVVGDIAVPISQPSNSTTSLSLTPVSGQIDKVEILGAVEDTRYVGKDQAVVVNRGELDGVKQGSVFELFNSGVGDFTHSTNNSSIPFPDRRIGHMMVVRPYQHFSIAIITDSSEAVSIETKVHSPRSR